MKTFVASIAALLMILIAVPGSAGNPVYVNATDLIEKVYGVADPNGSEVETRRQASERFSTVPVIEDDAEWLSSEDGFVLVYEGLSPEVEAMARYERGEVAGYGYIFYFPYEKMERESANSGQCEFCSALLQELSDMGIVLGSDSSSDALFQVEGSYKGGDVRMTLREEIESETITPELAAGMIPSDREGQFVLMISVVPSRALGFTAQVVK